MGNPLDRLLMEALTAIVKKSDSDSIKSLLLRLTGQPQAGTKNKTGQHAVIDPFAPAGMKYAPFLADVDEDQNDMLHAKTYGVAKRPEGLRFYFGQGANTDEEKALDLSELGLEHKILTNPSDSVRVADIKKMISQKEYETALKQLKNNPRFLNKGVL